MQIVSSSSWEEKPFPKKLSACYLFPTIAEFLMLPWQKKASLVEDMCFIPNETHLILQTLRITHNLEKLLCKKELSENEPLTSELIHRCVTILE
jgi:hypothetical protein